MALIALASIALCITTNSCANGKRKDNQVPDGVGKWTNAYANAPKLAGVSVSQYPEVAASSVLDSYVGKHPATITYFFWNGRVRQCTFAPDGQRLDDFWWPDDFLKRNPSLWNEVDFSAGSDPQFKFHVDPRKAINAKRGRAD